MSELDKAASSPTDEPILTYYAGVYDVAFIALHPFLKGHYGNPSVEEDCREKNSGEVIPWETVQKDLGFENLADLNRAIMSCYRALNREHEDALGAQRLDDYCLAQGVREPRQDEFPPKLEPALTKLFLIAGIDDVDVRAELDDTLFPIATRLLQTPRPWSEIAGFPRADRIIARDRSLLAIIEWDTTFTLIAGKSERLKHVDLPELFEGFAVTPKTRMSWWKGSV